MIRTSNDHQISKEQFTTCFGQNKMSTTALKAHHQHHSAVASAAAATASFQPNKSNSNKTAMTMSSLAADLCKAAAATAKPMEAVVVNSIIYSKPSFCSIVVDIGGSTMPTVAKSTVSKAPPVPESKVEFATKDKAAGNSGGTWTTDNTTIDSNPFVNEGYFPMASLPMAAAAMGPLMSAQDAHVYMMCTTMNGSINHHISELCDNLISMGLFDNMTNSHGNDHDDDSLIEFAYDDDDDDNEVQHTEEEDDIDDDEEEDEYETDDDESEEEEEDEDDDMCLFKGEDVVDFIKSCPIAKAPKEYCDKKKKVRFNAKPEVHVMHTWNYAYRAARKGHWEMYARDRERFKMRIYRVSHILNPILEPEHRQKVYENRFAHFYTSQKETPKELQEEPKAKKRQQAPPPIIRKTKRQKRERKEKRRRRMPKF
ncbi:protein phosphatase 1 regulatory subunit 15 [Haematobia irritans]|uniref:protein phosphatase 1 regulatory subunit 15 n=1 Tax=Haematobia irritans TaxID=7368 RepID=UPI003F50AA5A